MRNTTCPNCGGSMLGDGSTTVLHCERLSASDLAAEPDANPVYCSLEIIVEPEPHGSRDTFIPPPTPVDGETLTTLQMLEGWHYCQSFDGLLTQGEGPRAPTLCMCGNLRPFLYTFEDLTYRVYPTLYNNAIGLQHVYDIEHEVTNPYADLVPPDEVDIEDFPEIGRVLAACLEEAKRRYGSIVLT